MRVFVDTNVWLSGRFRSGLCADLLDALVQADAELLLDQRVLEEFRRIARDKFKLSDAILARSELFFDGYTVQLPAATAPTPGVPDPDDAWIIAAALTGGCDWFITGDAALLTLGRLEGMAILSPRAAYEQLLRLG